MSLVQLKAKCIERADACYAIASKHFNKDFRRVPVIFNNRLKRTAGQFHWNFMGPTRITLSTSILQLNPQEFMNTVGHEVAHHIAYEVYGLSQGHNAQWKSIMRLFGQEAKRCHSMETTKANTYKYNVNGNIVELGAIRHRKIQRGAIYRCSHGTISKMFWVEATPSPTYKVNFTSKTKSKADIVRAEIARYKAQGCSLGIVLDLELNNVAKAANMKPGLCRTYIKNNW